MFGVVVIVSLGLATARLLASSFELHGRTYASAPAFRTALRFEPRRIGATLGLATHLAFDHRTGVHGAAAEARRLVGRVVAEHAWNPQVRLSAANVIVLLDDLEGAQRLVDDHLRIFPNDGSAYAASAQLALRRGDEAAARALALRALRIFPTNQVAESVLTATGPQ